MLVALGPGGTREMAERALSHAQAVGGAPDWSQLGGLFEVSKMLDRSRQAIHGWINTASARTPEPLFRIEAGPIYDLRHWREWGRGNLDKMGDGFDPFAA